MQEQKPSDGKYAEGSLVFIWNADAGMFNAVRDSLHKWISPETYSCRLCQLTHGLSSAHRAWRNFLKEFERPAYFYYRDTFKKTGIAVPFPISYPLILELHQGQWRAFLTSGDLEEITTLEALIECMKTKISNPQTDSED